MMLARRTLCAMAYVTMVISLQAPVTPTQRCVKLHADRRALLQGGIGVASALVTPAFARTGSLMDSKKKSNYGERPVCSIGSSAYAIDATRRPTQATTTSRPRPI